MRASPARLVIALSVAAALAIFVVYTAVAGTGTPQLVPSQLAAHRGDVQLVGAVVGPVTGDAHSAPMRFELKDIQGHSPVRVPVSYRGSVPDLFKTGRHIVIEGAVRHGVFVAKPGSLVTKCPEVSPSAPSSNTCPLLARDHAARCGVLGRARKNHYERSLRPCIAWCSRPRS
ncbi:MAG: cytochrome c maturation protein CcmE [Gaiellaceae bacterium]